MTDHYHRGDIRFVDLFCGAGGATCGAWQAGATPIAGVDRNRDALETHTHNLPGEHIEHDLANVQPSILPPLRIDWVHGSPPCQGFSQALGIRDPDDPRNSLVFTFVEWVAALEPRVVTMENVVGMTTISNHFMDRVIGAFREIGYTAKWRILNAADYGVPQTRRRVITVAVRDDQPTPSRWFPHTTHAECATTTLDGRDLEEWVSVADAIGDLPPPDEDLKEVPMTDQQNEAHQKAGRRPFSWTDTPAKTIRTGTAPEVYPSIQHTPAGVDGEGDWRDGTVPAHTITGQGSHIVRGVSNHVSQDHTEQAKARFRGILTGDRDGKGLSGRVAELDRPCCTITADEGAAVPPIRPPNHDPRESTNNEPMDWESEEPAETLTADARLADKNRAPGAKSSQWDGARRLTVRECARLQSFPDWFEFTGTKTSQYAQVGNAVPPRLQQHLTAHVSTLLESDV